MIKGNSGSHINAVPEKPASGTSSLLADEVGKMILSASGWRKIFGRDEESSGREISGTDRLIMAGAALVFSNYLKKRTGRTGPCIAVATDSRPTGPQAADAVIRALSALGCDVRYLNICAAPEIMAYVKIENIIDGFIYISASHNPKGYNGIKFGPENGAVLGGSDSMALISSFRELAAKSETTLMLQELLDKADSSIIDKIHGESAKWKKESYKTYLGFALDIYNPPDTPRSAAENENTSSNTGEEVPGIIGDLNGSARCTSVDSDFFRAIGVKCRFINSTPGSIVHPILPEGENLSWCARELEKAHSKDSSFILGYMPDNDGDRGNLVYIDKTSGRALILKAQEVFALTCLAELSFMSEKGLLAGKKGAVAVNGPTSLRIDRIASSFGVSVFRAEVGEANVVNLALKLVSEGWVVRYLGEGSNGGSITLPSTVRDPLNTAGAIIRYLKGKGGESLSSVIRSLPFFTTTETDDALAKMKIRTGDHGILKERYEKIFMEEWEKRKNYLSGEAGITGWKEVNYMQTDAVEGTGKEVRGSRVTGGLKILFLGSNGEEKGFIWMRGSGTEPVFRVMADIEGENNPLERYLIKWQREMIEKADLMS